MSEVVSEKIGPNVKRLIVKKMALLAIPAGSGRDAFGLGIEALINRGKFASIAAEAFSFAREAVALMKAAPDNPYGDDDEAIAAAILVEIEKREGDPECSSN